MPNNLVDFFNKNKSTPYEMSVFVGGFMSMSSVARDEIKDLAKGILWVKPGTIPNGANVYPIWASMHPEFVVANDIVFPADVEGMFLRNVGGLAGSEGTYQLDEFKAHNHAYTKPPSNQFTRRGTHDQNISRRGQNVAANTNNTGGPETRPANRSYQLVTFVDSFQLRYEASTMSAGKLTRKQWKLPNPSSNSRYQYIESDNVNLNIEDAHAVPGGSDEITLDSNVITLPNRVSEWEIEVVLSIYHGSNTTRGDWSLENEDGSVRYQNTSHFVGDGDGSDGFATVIIKYLDSFPAGQKLRINSGNHGDGGSSTDDDQEVFDYNIIIKELPLKGIVKPDELSIVNPSSSGILSSNTDGTASFKDFIPVLDRIYLSNLLSTSTIEQRDTNNANQLYLWEDDLDNEYFEHVKASGRFVAKKRFTFQIVPWIRVSNATANDRAKYYTVVDRRQSDGTLIESTRSSDTYIRDDNGAYDKGGSGSASSMTINADEYIEVRTVRLFSQDGIDDNPADIENSWLRLDIWGLEAV